MSGFLTFVTSQNEIQVSYESIVAQPYQLYEMIVPLEHQVCAMTSIGPDRHFKPRIGPDRYFKPRTYLYEWLSQNNVLVDEYKREVQIVINNVHEVHMAEKFNVTVFQFLNSSDYVLFKLTWS